MNNVYDVITSFTHGQKHCVVARDMAAAERLYLERYPNTKIEAILLHAEYVVLPKEADKVASVSKGADDE